MTVVSIYSLVVTPLWEAALSITRSLYRPGREMARGLNLAYPGVMFPLWLRTLEVRVPPSPLALDPDSVLNDALATSCCTE